MKLRKLLPVLMAVVLLAACGKDHSADDDWEPPIRPTGITQPTLTDPTLPDPLPTQPTEPIVPPTTVPTEPKPTEPTWPDEEFNPPDEEHTHRFDSWRVGKKGNCIKEGYKVRSCDCGEMETKPYFGEHEFGEWSAIVEATCTEPGVSVHVCTLCNVEETTDVEALGHDEVVTPGTPATCTEDGISDRIHCARCEEVLQESTVVEAGHIPVIVDRTEPTCADFGLEGMEVCERCNMILQLPQVIDRLGHALVDGVCTHCTHTCDHGIDTENPGQIGQYEQVTDTGEAVEGTGLVYQTVTCEKCGESSKIVKTDAETPDEPEIPAPVTD